MSGRALSAASGEGAEWWWGDGGTGGTGEGSEAAEWGVLAQELLSLCEACGGARRTRGGGLWESCRRDEGDGDRTVCVALSWRLGLEKRGAAGLGGLR